MKVLGQDVPDEFLTEQEFRYLEKYANESLNLERMWALMDAEWSRCGAGYTESQATALSEFYESPVWLLNGLFTELDADSENHRTSIARWVASRKPAVVADFGGGFGSLARNIAALCPDTRVVVVEPHPTDLARHLGSRFSNLSYAADLPREADIVVAQDVLEHVADPLGTFDRLLQSVHEGGVVIAANCFYPVIKCHFPSTFHFRNSFRRIVPYLGCEYAGTVPNVIHAGIYRKTRPAQARWKKVRRMERLSRVLFPIAEPILFPVRTFLGFLRRTRNR